MKKDYTLIIENKIKAILIAIGLIILLLFYQYIPLLFLSSLGFKFNKLNQLYKIIYLFIINIIFIIFLIYLYRKDLKNDFNNLKKKFFKILGISIIYWLIGLLFMYISNLIIAVFNNGGISSNEEAIRELIKRAPVYMLFQVGIYAPFTEEIIFRKSIRDAISNKYLYIVISGLIFGSMHVLNMGSVSLNDLLYIISYGSLGSVFAALYVKTDNIYSSMLVHAIHNTITFILLIIYMSVI